MLCLKHAPHDPQLDARLREWLHLFVQVVRAPGGVASLDVIGRYLLDVNDITIDQLRGVLECALEPKALEVLMTGAETRRCSFQESSLLPA